MDLSLMAKTLDRKKVMRVLKERLAGEDGKFWLQRLNRLVEGEDPSLPLFFPMCLKIGKYSTIEELFACYHSLGHIMYGGAKRVLEGSNLVKSQQSLDLVVLTPIDLDFKAYTFAKQHVLEAAASRGFVPCSAEVGPEMIIQFSDNLERSGDYLDLEIVMNPVRSLNSRGKGRAGVLTISKNSQQSLHLGWRVLDSRGWRYDTKLVFVRRKEAS